MRNNTVRKQKKYVTKSFGDIWLYYLSVYLFILFSLIPLRVFPSCLLVTVLFSFSSWSKSLWHLFFPPLFPDYSFCIYFEPIYSLYIDFYLYYIYIILIFIIIFIFILIHIYSITCLPNFSLPSQQIIICGGEPPEKKRAIKKILLPIHRLPCFIGHTFLTGSLLETKGRRLFLSSKLHLQ